MKIYDVVIVGAGPAGSFLSLLLDKNKKILLLNASIDGKPCGGLLSTDAQCCLARHDLTLPKDVLVDPQIFSVKTIDLNTKQQRWYQRMYINVDRSRFDNWLIGLLPSNVEVINARCIDVNKKDMSLTYKENDTTKTVKAKFIVGADGANSTVRKALNKTLKTRKYIAIQQWYNSNNLDNKIKPLYSCIFDSKTSDCCSWIISKNNNLIYGGAFNPRNCKENFNKQKNKIKSFGLNLNNPIKTEACLVLRPKFLNSFYHGNKNVFLIGEAAGFISPSSLEGISSAIISAEKLARSINIDKNILYKYKKGTLRLRMKLIIKNLKCPFMYNQFLRSIVLKTGIMALK